MKLNCAIVGCGKIAEGYDSPDDNKIVHPVMIYDRRHLDYASDLRTPFIMPLIHQLKDAHIASQN